MWALRAILVAIIVIAIVAFALNNVGEAQKVDVNLVWKSFSRVALVEIVFWSFAGGVVTALFIFISVFVKQAVSLRSLRRKMKSLEAEVAVLRNRPIEESAELLGKNAIANKQDSPHEADN